MNKQAVYNAILASGYISFVILAINWISKRAPGDNLLMPVAALSLLVLSVAVMGFLFFYRPVLLLLEGNRKDAVRIFTITVAVFASITAVILAISGFLSIAG